MSFDKNLFFEQFVKNFIPTYQSLSRHIIKGDILRFFHKKIQELQNKFSRGIFSVVLNF